MLCCSSCLASKFMHSRYLQKGPKLRFYLSTDYGILPYRLAKQIDPSLQLFRKVKAQFSLAENLVLFNSRIVVPKSLRLVTLDKLHHGHQGIECCILRAKYSVWWPGITHHIKERVQNCKILVHRRKEPLLSTPLPQYPWQIVAFDLFEINGVNYLLVVEFFSQYPEIKKLSSTTSAAV